MKDETSKCNKIARRGETMSLFSAGLHTEGKKNHISMKFSYFC
jgi:hypothetical protein